MHKTSISVGEGVTRTTKQQRVLDASAPEEAEEFWQFVRATHDRLNQPWGSHSRLIAGLRERLHQIESSMADPANRAERKASFLERESEGWYVLQAVRRANLIEKYITSRPWEAVSLGIELGELVTEFAFKMDFERPALAGQKTLDAQKAAAKARRRQPREQRIAYVDELVLQGHQKVKALELAATHFGVKYQTVRNDYYRK